jgi:hypothetical protein
LPFKCDLHRYRAVTCHALALWVDFDTGGGGWVSTGPDHPAAVDREYGHGGDLVGLCTLNSFDPYPITYSL